MDKKHIILIVLLSIASISLVRATLHTLESGNRLEELDTEIAQLEEERRLLSDEIEYKQSDQYIEEQARNSLSLIKPGDKIFVVEGNDIGQRELSFDEDSQALGAATGFRFSDSNVYAWYKLFFD